MTTDRSIEIASAYEDAFGEDHAEELFAPNYMATAAFYEALEQAVKTGVKLTLERAAQLFGPPAWEEVLD